MRLLILLALACVPLTPTQAAPLEVRILPISSGVETFDPNTFGPGPDIDVYQAIAENPNGAPVRTIQVEFLGDLVNRSVSPLTFSDRTVSNGLGFGPNIIAESHFLFSPRRRETDILSVSSSIEDSSNRLAAAFTVTGPDPLIQANAEAILAAFAVPAGAAPPTLGRGFFVLDARIESFGVPEPSAGLLAMMALGVVSLPRCSNVRN